MLPTSKIVYIPKLVLANFKNKNMTRKYVNGLYLYSNFIRTRSVNLNKDKNL